jgi:MerR family transcriptional regulator, light-induced transcriptional regulator
MTADPTDPSLLLDGATFTVAAVARRLGVAPATLRTWDRRYELGPSAHTAGCHRRYTTSDLRRLELMRKLVNQGTPAGEAAKIAGQMNDAQIEIDNQMTLKADLQVTDLHLIDAPSRALARTALTLDGTSCMAMVNQWLVQYGAKTTWNEIISPVLTSVGERWLNTGRGIEVEHVLSQSVSSALFQYTAELSRPQNARPVLMTASAEEQHTMPMLATAAVLSEDSIACSFLGPRVPVASLGAAVKRIGPSAVFIWSQTPDTGDTYHLAELPQVRPATKYILGGPGWQPGWPPNFQRIHSLEEAVSEIKAAALS